MALNKVFYILAGFVLVVGLAICQKPSAAELTVTFSSPGDDRILDAAGVEIGATGTPTDYLVYFSLVPFDSTNYQVADTARFCDIPQVAGTPEFCTLTGLLSDTVYFVMVRAVDDAGNWSAPGAVISKRTPDQVQPAAIFDIQFVD